MITEKITIDDLKIGQRSWSQNYEFYSKHLWTSHYDVEETDTESNEFV